MGSHLQKKARGGAMARDLILCAMGFLGGRTEEELGSMATLGGGETIRGDGISVKVIQHGVMWNKGVTGQTI